MARRHGQWPSISTFSEKLGNVMISTISPKTGDILQRRLHGHGPDDVRRDQELQAPAECSARIRFG